MSKHAPRTAARADRPAHSFTPVTVRARHDGWTADRQVELIEALAESGCVEEACRRVGMSAQSAYTLRQRDDAQSFRQAWDAALDYAVRRLGDAAFARALHGVARPVFYKGEQIGEVRRYDERLTQFLLRYRDPVRYGKWRDDVESRQHPDAGALRLTRAVKHLRLDAVSDELGQPRPKVPLLPGAAHLDRATVEQEEQEKRDRRAEAETLARHIAESDAMFTPEQIAAGEAADIDADDGPVG